MKLQMEEEEVDMAKAREMSQRARDCRSLGQWKVAAELEKNVLEIWKCIGHPDTLSSMNNLAWTYMELRQWEQAESLLLDVIEQRMSHFGETDPDTLISKANLALTFCNLERPDEAKELLTEVMNTSRSLRGDEDPDTLTCIESLASKFQNQGWTKEAQQLKDQVPNMRKEREKMFGKDYRNDHKEESDGDDSYGESDGSDSDGQTLYERESDNDFDETEEQESDSDGATLCSPIASIAMAGLNKSFQLDKTLQLEYSNVILHSYGNPYWWFLCEEEKASYLVKYNPLTKATVQAKFSKHAFKSMVTISDRVCLLHQNGCIFSVLMTSNDWESEHVCHHLKAPPVALLGCSEDVLVVQCKGSIAFVPFGKDQPIFNYPYARNTRLQAYNFDASEARLLLPASKEDTDSQHPPPLSELQLVRKPNDFTLKVKKHALEWPEGDEEWDEKYWMLVAISKHGDVAFANEGTFVIINPLTASKTAGSITIGDSLENNDGGPSCFAGRNDQYFLHCGTKYAEIAGVELVHNDWGSREFWVQEKELVDDLKRIGIQIGDGDRGSFIRDPGFDGQSFIVRVKTDCKNILLGFLAG